MKKFKPQFPIGTRDVDASIKCLYNEGNSLDIHWMLGHDLWMRTERNYHKGEEFDFNQGQTIRICSWQGAQNFGNLYEHMTHVVLAEAQINKMDMCLQWPNIDLEKCEKSQLIEEVADCCILTVYRDQMGHVGVQTTRTDYPEMNNGPVVWLAAPKQKPTTRALIKRQKLFTPLFDQVTALAETFNRPKPANY